MFQASAHTRDEPGRTGLDRRRVLGGGGVLLTGLAGIARAQEAAPDALSLSANLLTRMAAAVRLNGRPPRLFVIDTGAERTSIARDLAEDMGLSPGPTVVVHGITSAQPTATMRLGRLTFGSQRFNDLILPVFDRSLLAADGLLGLDVLSQFRLSMDLKDRTVSLTPTGPLYARGSASIIPTRLPGGSRARADASGQLILTNALADGVAIQSFVDSGAQYSIGNTALLRAIGGQVGSRPIPLYGVTGQTIDAFPGGLRSFQIGRRQLGPTPLLFANLHAFATLGLADQPALLIGADVLYRFRRVELDFGARRMGFGGLQERQTPSATEPEPGSSSEVPRAER